MLDELRAYRARERWNRIYDMVAALMIAQGHAKDTRDHMGALAMQAFSGIDDDGVAVAEAMAVVMR